MDAYRIDSHKLMLHPRRVADWLDGKDIAPLYMEVSPSGTCNHRCSFCGMDFMGYKQRFLPTAVFSERLVQLGQAGLTSIMYAGEGEPFLHPDMPALTLATKAAGIDVAFTTNGVLLTPDIARTILPVTSWIKVSCNAGTAETYARIHGTKAEDFDKALAHVSAAVALRTELQSACTLGVQMVLLPENAHEALTLAQKVKASGADYLVIKPYAVHRQSNKQAHKNLHYDDCKALSLNLETLQTPHFRITFRHETIKRREAPLSYPHCLALPFGGYVDSAGNVWGCLRHIGEERFLYGNLLTEKPADIFTGTRRHDNMAWCSQELDIQECHVACRMDAINQYLWELTHPDHHVNFI